MQLPFPVSGAAALALVGSIAGVALTKNAPMPTPRAICATSSREAAEAAYLAENAEAMQRMMVDMTLKPIGDVDADFVSMMIPHHQGAIAMSLAVLRHGRNPLIKRLAQEIIVTQQQEIAAMNLAVGQPQSSLMKAPIAQRSFAQSRPVSLLLSEP